VEPWQTEPLLPLWYAFLSRLTKCARHEFMQTTVTLPDDLAAPLLPPGQDPARLPSKLSALKPTASAGSPLTSSARFWVSPPAVSSTAS
jgi:hypothetical protein